MRPARQLVRNNPEKRSAPPGIAMAMISIKRAWPKAHENFAQARQP
jgi:hypothetical protein